MSRPTRLVVLPLVAAVVGVATAAVVMGLVLLLIRENDGDSWRDLGLIVVGMALAVVTGVVVWMVGLARAARRLFEPGRRLGVVIAAVAAVFVLVVLVNAVAQAALASVGPTVWLGALLALAVPSVIFRLWDRPAISL